MKYSGAFCTLSDVARQFLEEATASGLDPDEEAIIASWNEGKREFYKDLILQVSDKIGTLWHRSFLPFLESYEIFPSMPAWNQWSYENAFYRYNFQDLHDGDCLALSSVSFDGETINSNYYRLEGNAPHWYVTFDASNVNLPSNSSFDSSAIFTGTWGYHENPSQMWKAIGTVPAGGLTSSATSLTSDSLDNLAEIYGYWQIGTETLFITEVNTTTHEITFERGVLGTTAAAHLEGASIKRFMPMPQVIMAVRRMIVLMDNKKAEIGDITVIGDTTLQVAGESIKLDIARRWRFVGV